MSKKSNAAMEAEIAQEAQQTKLILKLARSLIVYNPAFKSESPEDIFYEMISKLFYRTYTAGVSSVQTIEAFECHQINACNAGALLTHCEQTILEDCLNILWLYYTKNRYTLAKALRASGSEEGLELFRWERDHSQNSNFELSNTAMIGSLTGILRRFDKKNKRLASLDDIKAVRSISLEVKIKIIEKSLKTKSKRRPLVYPNYIRDLLKRYTKQQRLKRYPMLSVLEDWNPHKHIDHQYASLHKASLHTLQSFNLVCFLFISHLASFLKETAKQEADRRLGLKSLKKVVKFKP